MQALKANAQCILDVYGITSTCQFVLIYVGFVFHQGKLLDIYDYLAHSPQMGPDSEAFNC